MLYNTKVKIYPGDYYNILFCNSPIFDAVEEIEKMEDWEASLHSDVHKIQIEEAKLKYILSKIIEDDEEYKKTIEEVDTQCKIKPDIESFEKMKQKEVTLSPDEQARRDEVNRKRAVKRAQNKILDITLLNNFEYFVTFTFDPSKIDSFDINLIVKKLKSWLSNLKQRQGIEYIMIPEQHKSGRIHLHGLFKNVPKSLLVPAVAHSKGKKIKLDKWGKPKLLKTKKRQQIYNFPLWRFGYSTCIKLVGERIKVANYITKYITKDTKKLFGKYYYSSRNLKREPKVTFFNTNYNSVELKEYLVPNTRRRVKYYVGYENIALKYIIDTKVDWNEFEKNKNNGKESEKSPFNEIAGKQMPLEGFKWNIYGDKIIHNPHGATNCDWT